MKTSKFFCGLLLVAFCQSALADTLVVTNADDNGEGSLRDTVAAANAGDVIQFDFPEGSTTSIILTSGDIAITQSLTIEGPTTFDVEITTGFNGHIFTVSAPTTISNLTLLQSNGAIFGSDVTLTDCLVQSNLGPALDASGTWQISRCTFRSNAFGAIHSETGTINIEDSVFESNKTNTFSSGGALRTLNSATFALTNCTLTDNTATEGGAITSAGTVILSDCTLSNNRNEFGTGGTGGAIYNAGGLLTITRTLFSGNSTNAFGIGGAIYSWGTIEITDSTFSGNTAPTDGLGGAIYNDGGVTVRNSTFSGNSLGDSVDGIVQGGAFFNAGTLTIANSTIASNTTGAGGEGAGIYSRWVCTIDNSTISGNVADGSGGGLFSTAAQPASLANAVVASNTASSGPDISGPITSRGYNLIGDTSGNTGAIASDLVNVNPQLGPLQNNGGPTETMALLPVSPAIDRGDPAFNANAFTPPMTTDQRGTGFPRTNGPLDIGAFEAEAAHAPAIDSLTGAQTVECTSPQGCGASVTVDVSDSEGHPLTVEWIVNNQVQQTNQIPSGGSTTQGSATYSATFPLGTTAITVRLSDGQAAPVTGSTSVTVIDTTPPSITSISASPNVISTPNKKMVPVSVSVSTTDICDPNPTCKIVSVTSNEPGADQYQITGDLTVNLRADRNAHGNGRIYTITVQCTDASDNFSTRTVTVTVPKSGK